MAEMTIILPHRRNPGNDRALQVALSCLVDNTVSDFALLIDAAYDSPLYPRVNAMVEAAPTEICVYWSSDTFAALDWDTPMLEAWTPETIVTNVLVEPGAIALHHLNLHKDFGRKPETFRREEFEIWAAHDAPMLEGEGWYCPYMFSRRMFLDFGGLIDNGEERDSMGFTAADKLLFARWKAAGNRVVRARSYAFHLQRWSDEGEQTHEKRDMHS